jgi:hypothetical protein
MAPRAPRLPARFENRWGPRQLRPPMLKLSVTATGSRAGMRRGPAERLVFEFFIGSGLGCRCPPCQRQCGQLTTRDSLGVGRCPGWRPESSTPGNPGAVMHSATAVLAGQCRQNHWRHGMCKRPQGPDHGRRHQREFPSKIQQQPAPYNARALGLSLGVVRQRTSTRFTCPRTRRCLSNTWRRARSLVVTNHA